MTITSINSAPSHADRARLAAAPRETARPRLSPVPSTTEARGFALYVGLDEVAAASAGVTLPTLVDALRRTIAELTPGVESYATVALAPRDAGGRDLDVVRVALRDPSIRSAAQQETETHRAGVVVDLTRNVVTIDGQHVSLTYTELRLLQHLIANEGRTVARHELLTELWHEDEEDAPSLRTIDVHVRRLRAKLGQFEDIVRTVRGAGYRFDPHADVQVRAA